MDFQTFRKLYDQESGGDQQPAAVEPEQAEQSVTVETQKPSADFNEFRKLFVRSPDDWQQRDFDALLPGFSDLAGVDSKGVPYNRVWLERARGHSKTYDVAVMVAWVLLVSEQKITGLSVAGSESQSKRLIDAIDSLLNVQPRFAEILQVQAKAVVNKNTGSRLSCVTSSARTSFGHRCDFLIADELSNWVKRDLWDSVLSTAGKSPCLLVCLANAGLKDSWQWEVRNEIKRDSSWYFSRPDNEASWLQGQIEEQRKHLPDSVFRRLWLNEWLDSEFDGIPVADIEAAITQSGSMDGTESGYAFAGGLDIGVLHDHCAFAVVAHHIGEIKISIPEPQWSNNSTFRAMQENGLMNVPNYAEPEIFCEPTYRLRLAHTQTWKPPAGGSVDLMQVEKAILQAHKKYKLSAICYDPCQAEMMSQRLQKCGIKMVRCGQSRLYKRASAALLLDALCGRKVDLYNDKQLICDLKASRVVEMKGGSYELSIPRTEDGHCDILIAFGLALGEARCFTKPPAPVRRPITNSTLPAYNPDDQPRRYQGLGLYFPT